MTLKARRTWEARLWLIDIDWVQGPEKTGLRYRRFAAAQNLVGTSPSMLRRNTPVNHSRRNDHETINQDQTSAPSLETDGFAGVYAAELMILEVWWRGMVGLKRRGPAVRRLALSAACIAGLIAPASADTLRAHYSVTLMGLRIGDLYADGSMEPQAYKMGLNAHLTGLAAMISSVKMALASTGSMKKGALAPSTYATSAENSAETRTLRMALNSGTVKQVEISPPPEYRGDRVPVTEANKRNILDPTSALIMPVPLKEPLVGPAACDRTLPIYDGYARFDIALHYVGTRDVAMPGYSGPVSVCAARYHPISGHLVNSRSTAFMAQNDGIEVWLAPIEHAHVVVPLKVSMPTMTGTLDIEAIDFETGDGADATH